MILGHTIALDPTAKQANALTRAVGVARSTYNWGLAEWRRQYEAGLKPNANKLKKEFNAIKRERFPWVMESPRDANSAAFTDLNAAFSNFFKSLKGDRKGERVGYPQFRKKGKKDAFYVANDKFSFSDDGARVRLPVIGSVRIHETLRLKGKIMGGRVRLRAGRWYLSVQVETEARVPTAHLHPIIGADLGLKTAVFPSRGSPALAPKPLKNMLARLRRANRTLHRRKKGSHNRRKAVKRVGCIHGRIADVRKDFMHKITTRLCRENQTVVIEDLNVRGMMRNHRLARALSDVGFGMFRILLTYKAIIYGCELVVADRWFPSSKRCHACGYVKDTLDLSERVYRCEACGLVEDRDKNASLNLEQYPRLEGNWNRKVRTPGDEQASTHLAGQVSKLVQKGRHDRASAKSQELIS